MPSPQYSHRDLKQDAFSIWQAGVDAVKPRALLRSKITRAGDDLVIDDCVQVDLRRIKNLILVGAGKASAEMAIQLTQLLRELWSEGDLPSIKGWVNAPEGAVSQLIDGVSLCEARPVGSNSPTERAIEGTHEILRLISAATSDDLVINLISGGGSALLVAPRPGVSLSDKQAVAKFLAAAGGNIAQLNAVRTCLSAVKGGGLARRCRAGRLISLIISDVIGDSISVISSGPTHVHSAADPIVALETLKQLGLQHTPELANVINFLQSSSRNAQPLNEPKCVVDNIVLGNLADAVDAAGVRAVELGYRYVMQTARESEGDVLALASVVSRQLIELLTEPEIDCWISGGEPTVQLPAKQAGLGGRNQQLVLAVLNQMRNSPLWNDADLAFLSGGTDGEDGPTDAAGAWFDDELIRLANQRGLDSRDFLDRADAYHFFNALGGLIKTGPTGTNVCDLRIALLRRSQS